MTDRELISACRKLIGMYGTLRYCSGGWCACMGCVNSTLTKSQYEYALTLPEVQEMIEDPSLARLDFITDNSLEGRLKRYKEKKHGKAKAE
ncbi:hypothetical protein pEaSNUABM56_00040 [Erwinia phage pEa_SNUABM_56]|uniref:Uncharacterized protein n=1 Tax=Erwinia phage pEp_SNUABM_01 TaxID=2601643 RepID=A0A5J6DAH0_9CAUD|nr:hypothetical protein HWC63_gp014 [Erwinia phage pEp_SNUABM_01]QEQ94840.1 hypothetical protein pEpSNUABM01_014 [Erwinia phage pEp_SNUABM_01]UYL85085.1 hypothetical protein pEaSNUABM56_00040 [Erwinia phage pEa_SNUABM_56]